MTLVLKNDHSCSYTDFLKNEFMRNINRLKTSYLSKFQIDPQAPVAQKIADEVVFRRFQGEEVEFF